MRAPAIAPLLSIITPLYNRAWCIADCIASIGLKGQPAEMIIVDDGSTDGSVAAARASVAALGLGDQVRIVEQANGGPSAARNRAADLARGDWLVFLDSDDLWFPWTLPGVLAALPGLPGAVELAFLQGVDFADPSVLEHEAPAPVTAEVQASFLELVRHRPKVRYGACNAAIRRAAFAAEGGFSPELRCSEDTDLFLRMGGGAALLSGPRLVALRRSGHESLSGNAAEVARGFEWMLAANTTGRYPGPAAARGGFLAGSCAHAIRIAFATGHPGLAYRLYAANARLLANPLTRHHLLRLPLTPLLHVLKPQSYPFRLSPRRR